MIFTEPDKAVGSEIIIQLPEIIITDNIAVGAGIYSRRIPIINWIFINIAILIRDRN